MADRNYNVLKFENGTFAKVWNRHVKIEDKAVEQIQQAASMPFVRPYIAVLPDAHWGMGATVGSVIPSVGAVMPSAVGVDIGCGMMAVRTSVSLKTVDNGLLQENLKLWFDKISAAVPHGRTNDGGAGDRGAWGQVPDDIHEIWVKEFEPAILDRILNASNKGVFNRHPGALSRNAEKQLGTLGTGNHFIEISTEIDNPDSNLYVVLHSGSRGFGNRIGTYFTKLAGDLNKKFHIELPNKDLGYLPEGTPEYEDYLAAVNLAQQFAWRNREIMMSRVLEAIGAVGDQEEYDGTLGSTLPVAIHMHHNYMEKYPYNLPGSGDNATVNLTRKGAVDASLGKWVIIPGSMGAKTYLGVGLGNPESFNSCSHGAGRAMSRGEALRTFSVKDHEAATAGVVCDKTEGTLDETPSAYKDIDAVMLSQKDLVTPVLKLKQLVSVKGLSD